ncbi:GEVED domain-containing protein [uncultured Flavobacterium sp.]|uniref:GEVED domain-containing protein n=1 Tax=uncultured Flavobacterium sp. TaxID=165435 RepID=UPI0025FAA8AF|nr:GEVED domain-containing protein [uncultured Flavobacterium sp.]
MKTIYFYLLALLCPLVAVGQGTATIGSGTGSGTSVPIASWYTSSATESIYLGSEIGITGSITRLAYNKASGAGIISPNVKIYMRVTTAANVGTASYSIGAANFSQYTLVYDGTIPNSNSSGWMELNLTPFQFLDTSKNLSVIVVGATCISSGRPQYRNTTTGSRMCGTWSDGYQCGSAAAWDASKSFSPVLERPNIRLTLGAATLCSGTPSPGNTVSSAASVCPGSGFTLSLQNEVPGGGISYQWQSSANGTSGWANITGATLSTLSATQTQSAYYRCNVTCSGATGASTALHLPMATQAYATLPYQENFEAWQNKCDGISNVPSQYGGSSPSVGNNSWRRNDQGATASWSSSGGAYSPVSQSGTYSARFHTYDVGNGQQGSLDLYLNCTGGSISKTLSFYYINASGTDKMEVFLSVNGGTTFTKLGTDITTASSWTLQTREFTSSSAQTIIRFTATSDYQLTDIGLDNLMVNDTPTCFPPTAIAAGSIQPNSANLSWTAATPAPGNGYEYYLSSNSTLPTSATTPTAALAGTSVALSGLIADTNYYVWVRSICSSSDKSAWSNTYNFFTGYCSVSTTNTGDYINAFSTTGAAQNVSYTATSQPSGSYSNRSAQAIQQYAGSAFNFSTAYTSGANYVNIWIDWNNNLVFDANEKVFNVGNSSTSKTGTITIPQGTAPGNYRLRVRSQYTSSSNPPACGNVSYGSTVDFTVTVLPCFTWTGALGTDWATPANWCGNVVPGAADNVTIGVGNNVIISSNSSVGGLTIAAGASVTIKENATLTVHGALANNGQLIIESNASLVQKEGSTYSGTGSAEVTRKSSPLYRLDYTLWSSPVSGQKLQAFSPETLSNRFYTYNPLSDSYSAVANPLATDFSVAKGYLIRVANTHPAYVGNEIAPLPYTGIFNGVPNNGTISVAVVPASIPTDEDPDGIPGFNAIGNPYPSSINIAAFFLENQNNLAANTPIYFWRKKNDSGTSSYCSLTLAAYNANTSNPFGDSSNGLFDDPDHSDNWTMSPGQGFIVKAKTNAITFKNSMREGVNNGQLFRTAMNAGDKSRLWLNLSNTEGAFAQAAIAYTPNTTAGLDYGWDGAALTDGDVSIYTVAEASKLSIQARQPFEVSDVVPVEYKITTAGTYRISLDHFDGIFGEGQPIYLRDNFLGITHDLESPYEFVAEAGETSGRFDIMYVDALDTDLPVFASNAIIAYVQGNVVIINTGNAEMKEVSVYDIRGRMLYFADAINAAETSINTLLPEKQVLIVRVKTTRGSASRRIVF